MTFREYLKEQSEFKIYCDMDGVLCDFDKGIFDIDGKTTADMLVQGDPELDMWKHIDKGGGSYKFYANLEWLPEGKRLWNYIKDLPNLEILSSLGSNNPDKEATKKGKQEWLKKNNITIPQNFSERAAEKKKWAKPNAILIDDYSPNIKDWKEAGGIAIQFKIADEAINKLKELIKNGSIL